ncbi:hypothetical protein L6452_04498 [Arctium lappa]|uniref:Uncharacterized protein n=1 Tax=Arctium lappa TaxID=4217 RepID=A0ACB9EE24_ARCLA|nr:hypothetical protein L6452_04498 [Arctium lappa]
MSSSVQKARLLLCFDGQWVQNNNGWDYTGYTKRGVNIPVMVSYKTFIDYVVEKCGIGDSAACKLVFRRADGSLMEITNDDEILGFMLLVADLERPPRLFVYVAPLMCDDEDDDEIHVGGSQLEPDSQFQASYDTTLYSDHSYRPNDSYPDVVPETQLEEEEDPKRRFVGVADDETHVFTTGISDLDRSDTDNDEDEEEETYTPSNKSFVNQSSTNVESIGETHSTNQFHSKESMHLDSLNKEHPKGPTHSEIRPCRKLSEWRRSTGHILSQWHPETTSS